MNWDLFAAFLVITAVLIVVPGPIVTLIIATGARQGVRPALMTVAGTSIGNAILLAAIALGLGWVLQNAEALFVILRWVGAAYLIWLGILAWRHAGELTADALSAVMAGHSPSIDGRPFRRPMSRPSTRHHQSNAEPIGHDAPTFGLMPKTIALHGVDARHRPGMTARVVKRQQTSVETRI